MIRLLALLGFLLLASTGVAQVTQAPDQPWPNQCPAGALPTSVGCQPQGGVVTPEDVILGWQINQQPSTRGLQMKQITNEVLKHMPPAGNITIPPPASTLTPNDLFLGWQNTNQRSIKMEQITEEVLKHVPDVVFPPGAVPKFPTNGWYNAADFGVKADGVTSDDVAMKAAVDACAATGGKLVLPIGDILLTGAATIELRNCHLEGIGIMGGPSHGTMFLITNASVKPFTIGDNWGISGSNFYYPNQLNGTTVYPPLFSPTAGGEMGDTKGWFFRDSVIANAYDAFVFGGGRALIKDSFIYAVHDAVRVGNIGDSFMVSGVHFTPGPWFTLNSNAPNLMNVVTNNNSIFKAVGVVNMSVTGVASFGWRYGLKVEAAGNVGISEFDWTLDGVGTVLDASSGGIYATQNVGMVGTANCTHVDFQNTANIGNAPCFNLGQHADLVLNGFVGEASGSVIVTAGANVIIDRAYFGIGHRKDGGDYYAVQATANTGGTTLSIHNSSFGGQQTAHEHGIKSNVVIARLILRNSSFLYMNDEVDVLPGPTTIITSNWSDATLGPWSVNQTAMASSGYPLTFANNQFKKPPTSTASNCGVGPSVFGTFSGFIQIGSGTVTTCDLQLPWAPYGPGGGACIFAAVSGGTQIGASVSGSPPKWHVTTSNNIGGQQLFFNCPGAQ